MISAIPMVPISVGAHRIIEGVSLQHVCGDPLLSKDRDKALMMRITEAAFRALRTPVDKPTLFKPIEEPEKEPVHAS